MKLGIICESSANAYYRAIIPMHELERRGHTIVWLEPGGKDVPMARLYSCDLVHCYRRLDRLEDLRSLSKRGIAISFDNDDNHAAAEISELGRGLAGRRHNRQLFREVLDGARLADLTTTPSELLAERYCAEGAANVVVIENYLARNMSGFATRQPHDGIVIGWVAGKEHKLDLERLPIAKALEELLVARPQTRVISVGMRLPLHSDRYEHRSWVDLSELLTLINRIDVGIAPLANTLFNRCRSNIKLKEYASGGATWLASAVGPYRELGESHGGALVDDDDWFAALTQLVDSPRRRRRLTTRALRWAKKQTIDHHADAWEQAFERAVADVGVRGTRPTASAPR